MIEYKLENLSDEQEAAVRRWLDKNECATLQMVVEGKVRALQIDALNDSLKGTEQNGPAYLDIANSRLQRAYRYSQFLSVLDEIKTQTAPLTVTRIT